MESEKKYYNIFFGNLENNLKTVYVETNLSNSNNNNNKTVLKEKKWSCMNKKHVKL